MSLVNLTGFAKGTTKPKNFSLQTDPPQITVYQDLRGSIKAYALRLLALTTITDPKMIEKIKVASQVINTPEDQAWTRYDAQAILATGFSPPTPSHVVIEALPGHGMIKLRAVAADHPLAQELAYRSGKSSPSVGLLHYLRAEGVKVAKETVLEVPVKLGLDDEGLVLVVLHRMGTTRSTARSTSQGTYRRRAKAAPAEALKAAPADSSPDPDDDLAGTE